jgi:hypothetical protein
MSFSIPSIFCSKERLPSVVSKSGSGVLARLDGAVVGREPCGQVTMNRDGRMLVHIRGGHNGREHEYCNENLEHRIVPSVADQYKRLGMVVVGKNVSAHPEVARTGSPPERPRVQNVARVLRAIRKALIRGSL